MKRKRQIRAVCLWIILALILGGCGKNSGYEPETQPDDSGKLKVVATIFPAYDFARQIGGEHAAVKMLLSPGEELHSYEPSPKDIIEIGQCDVFIYVGGESDTWVEDMLESIDTSQMTVISMLEVAEILPEEPLEGIPGEDQWAGHDHDHAHDEDCDEAHGEIGSQGDDRDGQGETGSQGDDPDGQGEAGSYEDNHDHDHDHEVYDEHVWTSPLNAKLIVEAIAEEFSRIDPENEAYYRNREAGYQISLDDLVAEFEAIRDRAVRTTIVVGDRFPYLYLAKFMELEYYAAFPGCAEETEPSAKTVAYLIDKVKEEQIPVVFYGEFASHLMADRIGEEAGAIPLLLHSCHNVTKAEFEAGVTYLDLMKQNAVNLQVALCTAVKPQNGD